MLVACIHHHLLEAFDVHFFPNYSYKMFEKKGKIEMKSANYKTIYIYMNSVDIIFSGSIMQL